MIKPSTGRVLKTAMRNSIREMLFLPIWWYTLGARQTIGKLLSSVKGSVRYFGVDVWAKNLFVPMYGDESLAGRAISFLVRLVVLMFRSLGVFFWTIVALFLTLVYLTILPIALIGFVSHFLRLMLSYA